MKALSKFLNSGRITEITDVLTRLQHPLVANLISTFNVKQNVIKDLFLLDYLVLNKFTNTCIFHAICQLDIYEINTLWAVLVCSFCP